MSQAQTFRLLSQAHRLEGRADRQSRLQSSHPHPSCMNLPHSYNPTFKHYLTSTSVSSLPINLMVHQMISAYIFWSVFTALIPTLFYFSIWKLGFEGHELAFASVLSPVLLGIPLFGSWARSHGGITSLHALTASGLASYVLNRPAHRLIFVTIANFAGMLRQVAEWSDTTDSYPATGKPCVSAESALG